MIRADPSAATARSASARLGTAVTATVSEPGRWSTGAKGDGAAGSGLVAMTVRPGGQRCTSHLGAPDTAPGSPQRGIPAVLALNPLPVGSRNSKQFSEPRTALRPPCESAEAMAVG